MVLDYKKANIPLLPDLEIESDSESGTLAFLFWMHTCMAHSDFIVFLWHHAASLKKNTCFPKT